MRHPRLPCTNLYPALFALLPTLSRQADLDHLHLRQGLRRILMLLVLLHPIFCF
jgi:hypothetical protein